MQQKYSKIEFLLYFVHYCNFIPPHYELLLIMHISIATAQNWSLKLLPENNLSTLFVIMESTLINTKYLQDGTIGDDLVVKPISAEVRSHISQDSTEYKSQQREQEQQQQRPFAEEFLYEDLDFGLEKRRTSETDDYAFLGTISNMSIMTIICHS